MSNIHEPILTTYDSYNSMLDDSVINEFFTIPEFPLPLSLFKKSLINFLVPM